MKTPDPPPLFISDTHPISFPVQRAATTQPLTIWFIVSARGEDETTRGGHGHGSR